MNTEEARRTVQAGLDRRKIERQEAEKEAVLEAYERDMIATCNEKCAEAKKQKIRDDAERLSLEQAQARKAAQMEAQEKEQARDKAATHAVKMYALCCLILLCLTSWTPLPLWAALTTAIGLDVFPIIYIYKLYFAPAESEEDARR